MNYFDVVCPRCEAPKGEPCRNRANARVSTHDLRVKLARELRASNPHVELRPRCQACDGRGCSACGGGK